MMVIGKLWRNAAIRLRHAMIVAALAGAAAPAMGAPVADTPVDFANSEIGPEPARPLLVAAAPLVDFTSIYSRAAAPQPDPAPTARDYAPDKPFRFESRNNRNPLTVTRRFVLPTFSATESPDFDRALDCMTIAIAYEAGVEPLAGLEAVGQVILNRTRSSSFPKSVCGVVFQGAERRTGCQFTFTCDGSLRRILSDDTLNRARMAASTVLANAAADHVAGATHYHADYVLPYWAATGTRVAKIGAHIFYRMQGDSSYSASAGALANEPRMTQARPASTAPGRGLFAPWGLATQFALNPPAISPMDGPRAP